MLSTASAAENKSCCFAAQANAEQDGQEHQQGLRPDAQRPAADPAQRMPQPHVTPLRPSSAKRPFVALSGMHTDDIKRFSGMLNALAVPHIGGLDQHM
jgi:hypothetical protein